MQHLTEIGSSTLAGQLEKVLFFTNTKSNSFVSCTHHTYGMSSNISSSKRVVGYAQNDVIFGASMYYDQSRLCLSQFCKNSDTDPGCKVFFIFFQNCKMGHFLTFSADLHRLLAFG